MRFQYLDRQEVLRKQKLQCLLFTVDEKSKHDRKVVQPHSIGVLDIMREDETIHCEQACTGAR